MCERTYGVTDSGRVVCERTYGVADSGRVVVLSCARGRTVSLTVDKYMGGSRPRKKWTCRGCDVCERTYSVTDSGHVVVVSCARGRTVSLTVDVSWLCRVREDVRCH